MLVKLISYCYNRYEAEKAKKKKNSLFISTFGVSVVREEQDGYT